MKSAERPATGVFAQSVLQVVEPGRALKDLGLTKRYCRIDSIGNSFVWGGSVTLALLKTPRTPPERRRPECDLATSPEQEENALKSEALVACSNCFTNEGLRLDAERLGAIDSSMCPRCTTVDGRKFTFDRLITLAQHFFVWGSVRRFRYGAVPAVQFNDRRQTDIVMPRSLCADVALLEDVLGIGFFSYEPPVLDVG